MADHNAIIELPFGSAVRQLREQAGLTQRQLAARLTMHHTMLGKLERGERTPKLDHAEELDIALETGGMLTRMWQGMTRRRYVPDWFKNLLLLEQRVREIRAYESTTIPGLLQTPDYARTLVKARRPRATSEEIEKVVETRVKRLPEIRKNRPLLWFIIKEWVFLRVVGSEEIMREQLLHITKLIDEGAIQVQVLPDTPLSADPGTPFRVMAVNDTHSVGYLENTLGGGVVDAPDKVNELTTLFGQLQAEAHPFPASLALIKKINGDRYGELD